MKVVLLAGGYGTRISEESHLKPKPMIEIGGMPILWHIMKHYSVYGVHEFIICAGYKQYVIKEYFANYFLHRCDVTFEMDGQNKMTIHQNNSEPWKVTVVDTGLNTMTGGRVKRIKKYIGNEKFFLTYGDGVSNVNLIELLKKHENNKAIVTLTGIKPEGRYGVLDISDQGIINAFREKSTEDMGWINGGFMVCEPTIFDYIEGDSTIFEKKPLEKLAQEQKLFCYKHDGFWQCMDTLRDKEKLEYLWNNNIAPWKVWD